MANKEHVALLDRGVNAWNTWRQENCGIVPDLAKADLAGRHLPGIDLSRANLSGTDFSRANLAGANFLQSYLLWAKLRDANLSSAIFRRAMLCSADFTGANLAGANLKLANLVEAEFRGADLTGCYIYGISAWELKNLDPKKQCNLVITANNDSQITVDNVEVAQFIYLLLHNQKVRHVIDTITSKVALILGRFTPKRKAVLDALRDELRKRDYLPLLFDFDKPANRDLTATVSTLAHMARFIIADLTDPSSIPYELATVIPTTPVPVQPILLSGQKEFAMFMDLQRRYRWVLAPHCYEDQDRLIFELNERVIRPAERKVLELR